MSAGGLLLVLRLMLAAVFAVAAVAKLADPAALRATLVRFGLPRPLEPAAVLLPAAELAIALALLSARLAWFGSLAALKLDIHSRAELARIVS
jgi:uncharacterized membrane protein YphA (DoxX/SURF4 family)